MEKQVIKVNNIKFANGVVGAIRFVAGKRGVVKVVPLLKSKEKLPTLRVSQYRDTAKYEAVVRLSKGNDVFCTARTPEKAFRKAVRAYWAA